MLAKHSSLRTLLNEGNDGVVPDPWTEAGSTHCADCHSEPPSVELCPALISVQFPQDRSRCENAFKNLGFESNMAVLHGMCRESVLCVGVECARI